MCSLRNSLAALLLLVVFGFRAHAQEPEDTVAHLDLQRSVITEQLKKPIILNQRGISGEVNTDKIASIPSFLGTPDPIRFVRLLPSVQLNTEMEGGLYMQGSEHSHTLIAQEGVPIYGASHMLGIFSVFNSPHYSGMRYSTSAGEEPRIGGIINMQLADTVSRHVSADLSAGLLFAQGTVDFPIGTRSSMNVSVRRTFINLVYGSFLKYEDKPMRYGFTDANLTWTWRPSRRDCIQADFFGGLDNASFSGGGLIENIDVKWYNAMGALHWKHYFSEATLKQTAYVTSFGLYPLLKAFNITGEMNSYIWDYGYKNNLHWRNWDFAAHLSVFHVQPQNPKSEGHFNDAANDGSEPVQNAGELVLSARYSRDIGYWLQLNAGMGVNMYLSPERRFYWGVTPEVSLTANLMDAGKINFTYGLKRQNIFQVGLTHNGMPNEFWVMAGDIQAPQWAHNFSLSYNGALIPGHLAVSAEVYYKQLYNQLEYVGTMMDLYMGNYSLAGSTLRGHGRAFGVNLMLQKQSGKLTGWISYAWSRSLRTFDNDIHQGEYTSNHERLHELDVVATYDFGRFDVGATFVVASGTPYTRPTSFYVVGSRMVCDYGPYNGERLPAYAKMDISANWYFHRGPKGKNGLNISMYNVLGRENSVGYGLHTNRDFSAYEFRPTKIQIKFLPAIAYFHTF